MNLFVFRAVILTTPRLSRYNEKAIAKMFVCLPNNKKSSFCYYINTQAKGRLAHYIFDNCKKGNCITIQGSMNIKTKKLFLSNTKFKLKKNLIIKIHKIYSETKK